MNSVAEIWLLFYPAILTSSAINDLRLGREAICGDIWTLNLDLEFGHHFGRLLCNNDACEQAEERQGYLHFVNPFIFIVTALQSKPCGCSMTKLSLLRPGRPLSRPSASPAF